MSADKQGQGTKEDSHTRERMLADKQGQGTKEDSHPREKGVSR
jgi:hypothetical protein